MTYALFRAPASVLNWRVLSVLALFLFVTGCDLVEETVFLDRQETFTFRFDGADISPDGQVESINSVDFEGRLDGFLKEDIVVASIIDARIERSAPPGANLNQIFASLDFSLDNGQRSTVASLGSMPGSREAPLDVTTTSVTSHARAANGFRGYLDVSAAEEIDPDRQYSVVVTVNISLELEGI